MSGAYLRQRVRSAASRRASGRSPLAVVAPAVAAAVAGGWLLMVRYGRRFAKRDRLHRVDAIVVLAGTHGALRNLDAKLATAAKLYRQGMADLVICSGRFSGRVDGTIDPVPPAELRAAVAAGRIDARDAERWQGIWDRRLGARYMRQRVIEFGVPEAATLAEDSSLHTRENAEYVLRILRERGLRSIILVTSPYHQRRAYGTFAAACGGDGLRILNHHADCTDWNQLSWFLSRRNRDIVRGERRRIARYRERGDVI